MLRRIWKDEESLLTSFKEGKEEAFDHFYREFFASLSYFANQLVHNPLEAQDIVQDCFVSLWKKRHQLAHIEDIKNYLYASVRYQCIKSIRKEQKLHLLQAPSEIDDLTIDKLMVAAELAKELFRQIANLAPGMQQVIKLYYLEGKAYSEIAEILGIDAESVRKSRQRAVLALRKTNFPFS